MTTIAQAARPHTETALVPVYHPEFDGDRDIVGKAIAGMTPLPLGARVAAHNVVWTPSHKFVDLGRGCAAVVALNVATHVAAICLNPTEDYKRGGCAAVNELAKTEPAAAAVLHELLNEIPNPHVSDFGRPCTEAQPWQDQTHTWCLGSHSLWEHPEDRDHFGESKYVDMTLAEQVELFDGTYASGRAEMYIQQKDTDAAPHVRLGMEADGHQIVMTPAEARKVALKLLATADEAEGIDLAEGAR